MYFPTKYAPRNILDYIIISVKPQGWPGLPGGLDYRGVFGHFCKNGLGQVPRGTCPSVLRTVDLVSGRKAVPQSCQWARVDAGKAENSGKWLSLAESSGKWLSLAEKG